LFLLVAAVVQLPLVVLTVVAWSVAVNFLAETVAMAAVEAVAVAQAVVVLLLVAQAHVAAVAEMLLL